VISLIAALSINRVIGRAGKLPWSLPADHTHFWRTTQNKPFIMGRGSFLVADPLVSDYRNVILTSRPELIPPDPRWETAPTLNAALGILAREPEVFVLGGGQEFTAALPRAQRMYLSIVETVVLDGDAYFPAPHWPDWQLLRSRRYAPDAENNLAFSVNVYERKG